MDRNRPHFLTSLAQHIASALIDVGVDEAVAHKLGQQQADKFAGQWSGQLVYVPKNLKREVEKKHASIRAEFNGTNFEELAAKYNIHPRTIYKILNKNLDDKI